jgi:hypothetical protein
MRRCLLLLLVAVPCALSAQNVTIKKVELAGEKIIVHYDLDDSNPSNEYMINLYASKDNYTTALTKVKGDIGGEVKPGLDKKVEWSLLEEYGAYKGRISLELRGKVYVAFAKLRNFDTERSYKRGKQYDIFWKAGTSTPISMELFKGNQRIQGEMSHPNSGSYVLSIPSNAKPGKDYRLKLTDTKNNNDVVFSPFFKVTPKVPTVVKAAVVVVVIGGAVVALGGKKTPADTGGTTVSGDIALPDLPK